MESSAPAPVAMKRDIEDEVKDPGLARIVQHDLRTPLNAIVVYSELLLQGQFGEVKKTQKDAMEEIFSSSLELLERIDALVNKLDGRQT